MVDAKQLCRQSSEFLLDTSHIRYDLVSFLFEFTEGLQGLLKVSNWRRRELYLLLLRFSTSETLDQLLLLSLKLRNPSGVILLLVLDVTKLLLIMLLLLLKLLQ